MNNINKLLQMENILRKETGFPRNKHRMDCYEMEILLRAKLAEISVSDDAKEYCYYSVLNSFGYVEINKW